MKSAEGPLSLDNPKKKGDPTALRSYFHSGEPNSFRRHPWYQIKDVTKGKRGVPMPFDVQPYNTVIIRAEIVHELKFGDEWKKLFLFGSGKDRTYRPACDEETNKVFVRIPDFYPVILIRSPNPTVAKELHEVLGKQGPGENMAIFDGEVKLTGDNFLLDPSYGTLTILAGQQAQQGGVPAVKAFPSVLEITFDGFYEYFSIKAGSSSGQGLSDPKPAPPLPAQSVCPDGIAAKLNQEIDAHKACDLTKETLITEIDRLKTIGETIAAANKDLLGDKQALTERLSKLEAENAERERMAKQETGNRLTSVRVRMPEALGALDLSGVLRLSYAATACEVPRRLDDRASYEFDCPGRTGAAPLTLRFANNRTNPIGLNSQTEVLTDDQVQLNVAFQLEGQSSQILSVKALREGSIKVVQYRSDAALNTGSVKARCQATLGKETVSLEQVLVKGEDIVLSPPCLKTILDTHIVDKVKRIGNAELNCLNQPQGIEPVCIIPREDGGVKVGLRLRQGFIRWVALEKLQDTLDAQDVVDPGKSACPAANRQTLVVIGGSHEFGAQGQAVIIPAVAAWAKAFTGPFQLLLQNNDNSLTPVFQEDGSTSHPPEQREAAVLGALRGRDFDGNDRRSLAALANISKFLPNSSEDRSRCARVVFFTDGKREDFAPYDTYALAGLTQKNITFWVFGLRSCDDWTSKAGLEPSQCFQLNSVEDPASQIGKVKNQLDTATR
ncbi:MAG: hypothetical protein HQL37_06285 [Alphaproteobacteria bacterium]|nr:hypothetical protein [Alphaproteobacteria bacterium]